MPVKHCSRCTVELSPDVIDGLCPACLLEGALGTGEEAVAALPTADARAASFPQKFGTYELSDEIARGGQGVVYRARHATLQRDVALKMFPVHPWTTEADLQRFRSEARIAAELDHPFIVPIYEIGELAGQHYFTMKLIDGVGADRLRPGELTPRQAAGIIAEAARALHHAHERGVLHRDIKPGNLLIDSAGHPHLSDFGIAKLLGSDAALTRTRELLGTPSYISPEAVEGGVKKASRATDIYGLGAVLYHLLTGNPPFAGGTTLETIRQVVELEPRRPRQWNPQIDRDLEAICLKCLEKDPARRYQTAAGLADDLDRWLRHQPVHARPVTLVYRSQKWLRRNAVPAALAAAAALGFGGLLWKLRPASDPPPAHDLAVVLRASDADSRYIAAEFSRNLIHLLGRLPGASVAPHSAVLKWESSNEPPRAVAGALRGPKLLFGGVRQSADRLHLEFALIDSRSAAPLWQKTYDVALAAGADAQAHVVRAVASALGLPLVGGNRAGLRAPFTSNSVAWMHYLRGRQLADAQSEPSLQQAIGEYEAAVARDPEFAQAYAALADAHIALGYTFREPAGHFAQARRHVDEALERDDTLADALVADGVLKYFLEWDWASAERSLARAVLLDSSKLENHGCYLHCLETVGRIDDALKVVRAAAAANPGSILIQSELGCANYYAGRFDEAAGYWRDLLPKAPDNAYLRWGLARTLAQQGKFTEAADELETAKTKSGGDWAAILAELAYVRGREKRREDARQIIDQLHARATREFIDPYLLAMAFAGLEETDQVFRQLNRAAAIRSSWIPSLPVDPKFSALRGDARFRELMGQLKLPLR